MSLLHILVVGLLSAGCHAMNYSFVAYKEAYGRTYASGSYEHQMREKLFKTRAAEIMSHNSAGRSWQKGFNQFTDRTDEEMAAMRGFKRTHSEAIYSPASFGSSVLDLGGDGKSCAVSDMSCLDADKSCCSDLICGSAGVCQKPAAVTEAKDWSTLATSKTILDQGSCGSCWAVAAAAAIQLQAAKTYKKFDTVLSPQSILSCTPNKLECGGQGGCRGATPGLGFEWVKRQGEGGGVLPLDKESYTASDDGATCQGPKKASFLQLGLGKQLDRPPMVSIGGWRKVEENSASKVMDALVTTGPLAVAIVGKEIMSYNRGVIDSCNKNFVVDHAVVMMGYGVDPNAGMYWNIRNSWGPHWGEDGYLRLRRHTPKGEEPCGWDKKPEVGVVCKDPQTGKYPEKTWVCGECGIISDVAYPVNVKVPPALLSNQAKDTGYGTVL